HDGQACTIEDWIQVFEDATGRDLSQFARWYAQAGTPRLRASESWDGSVYRLTLSQETPPTPGQAAKAPLVIPVAMGLLGADGAELAARTLELTETSQSWDFALPERPVPSLLRGFSAPVILERDSSAQERAFLLAHDTDPFNRWEASRAMAVDVLLGATEAGPLLSALDAALADETLDPAYRALLLTLPGEEEMARETFARGEAANPDGIHAAAEGLRFALAERLEARLRTLYAAMETQGPYSPAAEAAGRRALRNACLGFLARRPGGDALARAQAGASNMSERLPALTVLVHARGEGADAALAAFEADWSEDALVMDKWFALQALAPGEGALARVTALTEHPKFQWRTPNRLRSLVGAFAMNHAAFHGADGAGYRFLADWLLKVDALNPQTAARMAGAFETWRRYDAGRQALIQAELERIVAREGCSKDMGEIAGRILAA
ncbi:MAG: DUF3458 domain-containing protein, partial [Pseudomonadota bacterium]